MRLALSDSSPSVLLLLIRFRGVKTPGRFRGVKAPGSILQHVGINAGDRCRHTAFDALGRETELHMDRCWHGPFCRRRVGWGHLHQDFCSVLREHLRLATSQHHDDRTVQIFFTLQTRSALNNLRHEQVCGMKNGKSMSRTHFSDLYYDSVLLGRT